MQRKLSLLKRQIDRISRRDSKTTSKGKTSTKAGKKSFTHSRTNSHQNYSYNKYSSNQNSGVNTANQSGMISKAGKKKSHKSSKKRLHKGHGKSNSMATGSNLKQSSYVSHTKEKKSIDPEKYKHARKYYKDFNSFSKSKKSPKNVFNYREVRQNTKNTMSTQQSPSNHKYNLKYRASTNINSPAAKDHNFFVFLGGKDDNSNKNGKTSKYTKGSKSRKRTLNSLMNQRDTEMNKRYVKLANLIQKNPAARDKGKHHIPFQENPLQMKTDQSLFSNEMINFSEKIENFTKELQAMRGEVTKSPTSSSRPTVPQNVQTPSHAFMRNNSRDDRFISERSLVPNISGRSRSRPSIANNFTNQTTAMQTLNQSTLSNSEKTDRTIKMGANLSGRPLGMFSKTRKKTLDVIKELEKTMKMINEIKPEMKEAGTQAGTQTYDTKENDKNEPNLATAEDIEAFKPICFSNLNIMNLLKEVAKEILVKSSSISDDVKNVNEFCEKINDQIAKNFTRGRNMAVQSIEIKRNIKNHPIVNLQKDPEKQAMITQILNYYQEQIIFEEALAILQEKKVDLENLFIFAYQRLGINMDQQDDKSSDLSDSNPSFSVVTDASLGSVSGFGDGYLEPEDENVELEGEDFQAQFKKKTAGVVQSDRLGPSSGKFDLANFGTIKEKKVSKEDSLPPGNVFDLDFSRLVREEISDDED